MTLKKIGTFILNVWWLAVLSLTLSSIMAVNILLALHLCGKLP